MILDGPRPTSGQFQICCDGVLMIHTASTQPQHSLKISVYIASLVPYFTQKVEVVVFDPLNSAALVAAFRGQNTK